MNFLNQIISLATAIFVTLYPQKTLTEGLVGQPRSFIPSDVVTENDKAISKLLFRGLFTYDSNGDLIEDLADSYDVSDDGLEYTVYLKKDQKWSNGVEITADDLLYSAFTDPHLKEIATDKINKYTIRYTLPNKFSPFPHVLTQGVLPSFQNTDNLKPISSGPYKVVRTKKEGPVLKEIVLQNINSAYKIPRISFRFYENEDQLFTAFKLGEVDAFSSSEQIEFQNMKLTTFPLRGIYYSLIFNLRKEPLNNLDIRKKIAKAVPVNKIVELKGVKVSGPISESQYTKNDLNFNEYDPTFLENLNLKLNLILPKSKDYEVLSNEIKNSLSKIGINITVIPMEPSEIESKVLENRDFDMLLYGQEVSRDPDRYVLWHSTRTENPGLNLSGLENVRLDRSLEEGRNAREKENRIKHYSIFQEVIRDSYPAVFLYHPIMKYYTLDKVLLPQEIPFTYYSYDRFMDLKSWDIL